MKWKTRIQPQRHFAKSWALWKHQGVKQADCTEITTQLKKHQPTRMKRNQHNATLAMLKVRVSPNDHTSSQTIVLNQNKIAEMTENSESGCQWRSSRIRRKLKPISRNLKNSVKLFKRDKIALRRNKTDQIKLKNSQEYFVVQSLILTTDYIKLREEFQSSNTNSLN